MHNSDAVAKSTVSRRRSLLILLAGVIVLLGGFAYLGRIDPNELDVLRKFPYTVNETPVPEDGTVNIRYEIKGDPAAVLADLPTSGDHRPSQAPGTVYEFKLKSGRSARFLASTRKQQCIIMVEGRPDPMAVRALRRLGLM